MATQFISSGIETKDGGVMIAGGTLSSRHLTNGINPGNLSNNVPLLYPGAASTNSGWKLIAGSDVGAADADNFKGYNLYPSNPIQRHGINRKSTDYQEGHENLYNESDLSPGTIGFALKYIYDWSKVLDTSDFSLDANNTVFAQIIDFAADSGINGGPVVMAAAQPTQFTQ